ncbi:MAG TPA: hypothetical protein VKV39_09285 [Candidatus Sulfotelmatobacter sp.]|nr:hypothetical protein [Candidatus Sulfotelmatobacter sp.]
MKWSGASFLGFVAGLLGLVTAGWLMARPSISQSAEGLPTDWSHRHLIFSQPTTAEQLDRISRDPRYWQHWYRQNSFRRVVPDTVLNRPTAWNFAAAATAGTVHGDWAENMGSGATVGALNFPAKYGFHINAANCASSGAPDFVVFNTGLAGAIGQASIVAFDNLYSSCTGTVPTVLWAYNTGGQILTSPIISGNGSEVAFAQTSGGAASVVVLKWAAGTGTLALPVAPTSVASGAFLACTAPCMTVVALGDSARNPTDDTTSSVFPDYTHDVIWVGGTSSWLHKVSGVFRGAPAEVTTGGFPVQLNSGSPTSLSSPVYDYSSGQVFVGDIGGFFYRVSSAGVVSATTSRLDAGTGLVSGPIVDSTAQKVYVFSSNDGGTACGGTACSAIYSFSTSFASGSSWASKATVGTSSGTPQAMYEGAFDSSYFASGVGTGNLFVCGNTGLNPTLYRVPVTAGVFGTPLALSAVTQAAYHVACSPVSDVPNPNIGGGSERMFFSVQSHGRPNACATAGCVIAFVAAPWLASTTYTVGQEILVYRTANNSLYTQVAIVSGTSGTGTPTWPNPAGGITIDGTVHWMSQGTTTLASLPIWTSGHAYALHNRIVDNNGNVEIVIVAGTSSGSQPTFSTIVNGNTSDGGVTWVNAGVLPSAAQQYAGGSSGIIMDNTVGTGGGSQVYFTPLSDQLCATSGTTGGCAIQASQSAIQ